jgi:23S rRNA (pseudouridine1915-N3)-methyltransferase
VLLIAIGKLDSAYRQACDKYLTRLRRYESVDEQQLREGPATAAPIEQRRSEGKRILERLPERARVVALDREGTAWSSVALATALRGWQGGPRPIVLVIGGSTGLDESVLSRADHRWSLGPLTLPHQLARVVVLEQWYRAHTILRGEPYHK